MTRLNFRVWDKDLKTIVSTEDNLTLQIINNELTVAYSDSLHQITNYELLKSTGLKDKNGTEIYEGDIIKHGPVPNPFISNNYFEIIQARSGEWRMDNHREGRVLVFSNHSVEVIGSKFEHLHLLEEE